MAVIKDVAQTEAPAGAIDARGRLKKTALALFSRHGIDGVSVRDIVTASEMKNGASLHYYFGSKDGLVEELLVDCAKRSDQARQVLLEALQEHGGPRNVGDIVRLLVEAEASLTADDSSGWGGHNRFIMALQINHRRRVSRVFSSGKYSDSYRQCVDHIRHFMSDYPPEVVRDRIILMYLYIISTLAAREAALDHDPAEESFWTSKDALDAIIVTSCAMLTAPHQGLR